MLSHLLGMGGKKIQNFSLIAISFTVLTLALFTFTISASASTTLVVDADGFATTTDCDDAVTSTVYTTIQSAVTAASSGDTIIVCDGTYGKVNIPTGKVGLTLMSASNPIIECGASTGGASVGNGITIGSNGVTVQGFEIRFCDNGIRLTSIADTLIRKNDIHDNKNPSTGFQGVGILFSGDSDRNTVSKNKIFDNDRQGIFLGGSCNLSAIINSEQNVIRDNKISDNGKDLLAGDPANTRGPDASQYGIQLCEADNNVIINNKVTGHNEWSFGIGIYLFNSNNNLVAQNDLKDNRQGIVMFGEATNNVIIKNKIKDGVAPTCALPTCFPDIPDQPATGIRIFDTVSSGNTIAKNDIKDNAGWGVDVRDGTTVVENKAKANGLGGYVIKGIANTIAENKAEMNPVVGFKAMPTSSLNLFANNKATQNTGNGFDATGSATNVFVDNKSDKNTGFGFSDAMGTTNTYTANECKANTAGGSSVPGAWCTPQS